MKERHKARPRSKRPGPARKGPAPVNPPLTIEELSGGRFRFTHPAGRWILEPIDGGTWHVRRLAKVQPDGEPWKVTGCFCGSSGYPLRFALAYLGGARAEWGRRKGCKPLWSDKRTEGKP